MKRTWIRRAAAATTLAFLLTLVAPAQASGWRGRASGTDVVQTAWQWIARLWLTTEGEDQPARSGAAREKAGTGVDPSGHKPPSPPPQPVEVQGNRNGG
jgi:hypothetical protein